MGTAHVHVTKELLKKLLDEPYCHLVKVISATEFDVLTYQVEVSSDALPDGYNGQQEMWFHFEKSSCDTFTYRVGFRRDTDV